MIEAVSPYAVLTVIALLIVAGGVLWLCRVAMRSGSTFEGEVGNRLLSLKIRTDPTGERDPERDPGGGVPRGR
jgi:hypothetical protein